jgi:hypothetical protein
MTIAMASRPTRGFTILAAAGTLVAAVMLVRLVVFAVSPAAPSGWSAAPWSEFITRHACSTAYWVAATSVGHAPDIYAIDLYSTGRDRATGRLLPRRLGAFNVDPYEYPPTFLLAPRALAAVTPDYAAFRSVWLLLNAALVLAGMAVVARRLDGATGSRSLWLVPLALAPATTMVALQIGNAQLLFIVAAMVSLVAFERGRHALGGLLLAVVVVGKMFPAVLLLYLAVRREWRPVAWTAGWAGVLGLATIAAFGWTPFAIFLDHLPRLLSGDAFPMLRAPLTAANNQSVPGLVLKVPILGGPNVPFEALRITGWLYSALLVWVTVRLAMRPVAPGVAPFAWLTLLGLAALRSPFIPAYGAFPGVWIATMLLAVCWHDARRRRAILALSVLLVPALMGPTGLPIPVAAVVTTIQALAVLALMGIAVRIGRNEAASGFSVTAPAASAAGTGRS